MFSRHDRREFSGYESSSIILAMRPSVAIPIAAPWQSILEANPRQRTTWPWTAWTASPLVLPFWPASLRRSVPTGRRRRTRVDAEAGWELSQPEPTRYHKVRTTRR
jgi:hypothetical protein